MILDKKISYFGNIWYQSGQSPPESSGVWRTLAGLRGPVKIIGDIPGRELIVYTWDGHLDLDWGLEMEAMMRATLYVTLM